MIFAYFAVPREYQHRVLFYGVLGALVFRAVFIAAGSVLIASFAWVLYLFGAFLVLTGIQMVRQRNEHIDPSEQPGRCRLFRRWVPMTDEYHGQRFLRVTARRRRAGRHPAAGRAGARGGHRHRLRRRLDPGDLRGHPGAVPGLHRNAFAILGLRAMYFLLADLMHRFVYLKLGLASCWSGSA